MGTAASHRVEAAAAPAASVRAPSIFVRSSTRKPPRGCRLRAIHPEPRPERGIPKQGSAADASASSFWLERRLVSGEALRDHNTSTRQEPKMFKKVAFSMFPVKDAA